MRILIDECLDWRLGRALTGHDCVSVQKMGWGGIKNGRLLALAQAEFDVFLTADRNLSFQQNTTKFQIAVVVLVAGSTQLNKTLPLMPKVLALLAGVADGTSRNCQFLKPTSGHGRESFSTSGSRCATESFFPAHSWFKGSASRNLPQNARA